MLAMLSRSEGVLISTSLRSEAKKEGGAADGLDDEALCRLDEPASLPASADSPVWGGSRLVRGRFSFLSGSWCGSSCGSGVLVRDFRFRDSISLAFSRAPQASCSSLDCSGGDWGRGATSAGMLLAKTSRAPRRLAMLSRCCQRSCSCRSRSRSCCDRRRPS